MCHPPVATGGRGRVEGRLVTNSTCPLEVMAAWKQLGFARCHLAKERTGLRTLTGIVDLRLFFWSPFSVIQ